MIQTLKLKFNPKIIFMWCALILLMGYGYYMRLLYQNVYNDNKQLAVVINKKQTKNDELTKKNEKLLNNIKEVKMTSLIQFTKQDLMKDIITSYSHISNRVKKEIVETILKMSVKYNVNPLIFYSLLHTESSMRFEIQHKPTFVTINKKKVKVRAVGLGGVVWEWWGTKLKVAGIAQVRSDLFDPVINIKATAFIYNELYKLNKHPKASTQDESAMIRYFGGGYKWYFEKIDKKIAQLISSKMYRTKIKTNSIKASIKSNVTTNISVIKK